MEIETKLESKLENPSVVPNTDKLSGLAAQAREAEAGGASFMQPGANLKKKGPGRPAGSKGTQKTSTAQSVKSNSATGAGDAQSATAAQAPQPPPIPSRKIAEPVVHLFSKWGARIVEEPKAEMTPEEFNNTAEALGMVMDKWMPFIAGQYGAELFLCVSLGVWGTRLAAIAAVKKQDREKAEKEEKIAKARAREMVGGERIESPYFAGSAAPPPNESNVHQFRPPEIN